MRRVNSILTFSGNLYAVGTSQAVLYRSRNNETGVLHRDISLLIMVFFGS